VAIVIYPLDPGWYRVEILKKPSIVPFGPISKVQVVPGKSLAPLVLHTSIAANVP